MKKLIVFLVGMSFSLLLAAQQDSVRAGVYAWQIPGKKISSAAKSIILFEGKTRDLAWLQMNGVSLTTTELFEYIEVPLDEEHLYIVKKGVLSIDLHDSLRRLAPGSIALLLPGEHFSIRNSYDELCEYYVMKYRSTKFAGATPENTKSFIRDWKRIEFHPHDKGGIRNYFETGTAMTERMEMHVTTLNGGLKSHDPHTHRAAEIVLMIDGDTEMQIGQQFYNGTAGAVYYLSSEILHAIRNTGEKPAMYFAFQFE